MLGRLRPALPTVAARSVVAVLLVLLLVVTAASCDHGTAEVKRFTLDVRDDDDVDDLYVRGVIRAVDLCTANPGLIRAEWTFDDDDTDLPVVEQYTSSAGPGGGVPQSVECAEIPRNADGRPRSLPTIKAPEVAADPPTTASPPTTTSAGDPAGEPPVSDPQNSS